MFSSISSFFGRGSQPAAAQQDDPVQLKVSRIITYPIKSCAGIELQQSQYSIEGLTYDRKWMVIDAHTKRFITARTHPKASPRNIAQTMILTVELGRNSFFS